MISIDYKRSIARQRDNARRQEELHRIQNVFHPINSPRGYFTPVQLLNQLEISPKCMCGAAMGLGYIETLNGGKLIKLECNRNPNHYGYMETTKYYEQTSEKMQSENRFESIANMAD